MRANNSLHWEQPVQFGFISNVAGGCSRPVSLALGAESMKHNDPDFGELTFDAKIGWWEGRIELPSGSSFALYVHTPSEADDFITDAARRAFEKMKSSEGVARRFAATELLQIHNEEWSEGDPI